MAAVCVDCGLSVCFMPGFECAFVRIAPGDNLNAGIVI